MAIHKTFGSGKFKNNGNKPNDLVFTPEKVAKQIIALYDLKTGETVLDAFAGENVFYNNYPNYVNKEWCEINKGVDFFDYTKNVDWIITNPPYSIFDEVMEHSYTIADNIVYLIPLSKLFSSMGRIRKVLNYGNIKSIHLITASKCGFPFGFPACVVHIKKGYTGDTLITEMF